MRASDADAHLGQSQHVVVGRLLRDEVGTHLGLREGELGQRDGLRTFKAEILLPAAKLKTCVTPSCTTYGDHCQHLEKVRRCRPWAALGHATNQRQRNARSAGAVQRGGRQGYPAPPRLPSRSSRGGGRGRFVVCGRWTWIFFSVLGHRESHPSPVRRKRCERRRVLLLGQLMLFARAWRLAEGLHRRRVPCCSSRVGRYLAVPATQNVALGNAVYLVYNLTPPKIPPKSPQAN